MPLYSGVSLRGDWRVFFSGQSQTKTAPRGPSQQKDHIESAALQGTQMIPLEPGLGLCVDGNFFLADLAKALVLTEIGPKRDPDTLKVFLSNMERLLHAKAHGYRSSVP